MSSSFTTTVGRLRLHIAALAAISKQAQLEFHQEGLRGRLIGPAHSVYACLRLPAESFTAFDAPKEGVAILPLDLSEILVGLKTGAKENEVQLHWDGGSAAELTVFSEGATNTFDLQLVRLYPSLDLLLDDPEPPAPSAEVSLPASTWPDALNVVKVAKGSTTSVSVSELMLTLASGTVGGLRAKTEVPLSEGSRVTGTITANHYTDHLAAAVKLAAIAESLELRICDAHGPLTLDLSHTDGITSIVIIGQKLEDLMTRSPSALDETGDAEPAGALEATEATPGIRE